MVLEARDPDGVDPENLPGCVLGAFGILPS